MKEVSSDICGHAGEWQEHRRTPLQHGAATCAWPPHIQSPSHAQTTLASTFRRITRTEGGAALSCCGGPRPGTWQQLSAGAQGYGAADLFNPVFPTSASGSFLQYADT